MKLAEDLISLFIAMDNLDVKKVAAQLKAGAKEFKNAKAECEAEQAILLKSTNELADIRRTTLADASKVSSAEKALTRARAKVNAEGKEAREKIREREVLVGKRETELEDRRQSVGVILKDAENKSRLAKEELAEAHTVRSKYQRKLAGAKAFVNEA